jgi:hypothetical protein
VFWLGLFPNGALRKTEVAALQYQKWVEVAGKPPATARASSMSVQEAAR